MHEFPSHCHSVACKPEEDTPLRSMSKAFYKSHGDKDVTGQTISINLMNQNRPATLQGWTHVRKFSKGFIKTTSGAAFATVSKLKPGQEYSYGIYQYDSTSPPSTSMQATVSVNNGPPVVTEPNTDDKPTASGKAKADAKGSISFKFDRKPSAGCS